MSSSEEHPALLRFRRFLPGTTISSPACVLRMDLPAQEAEYRRGDARPWRFAIRDVENVRMTIHPSMDVPGVVKIDGKPASEGGTLKIGLSPTGTASRIGNYRGILDRTQTPDANGKVTIPRAAEGNYQVFFQGADNLFIADVRQGRHKHPHSAASMFAMRRRRHSKSCSLPDGGTVEGVVSNHR